MDPTRGDVEIRLHGRGGQGTVTMAALFADAAYRSGWSVLAFPTFGTERTGAPVAAFVRLSRGEIRDRGEVNDPSVVVIQDATLVDAIDVTAGLAPDGLVVINAERAFDGLTAARLIAVPLTDLAVEHLGKPITSTALLGVLTATTELVTIDAVEAAIRERFRGDVAERNVTLARAARELMLRHEVVA